MSSTRLNSRQQAICDLLTQSKQPLSRSQIASKLETSVSKTTLLSDLNKLANLALVEKHGAGTSTTYSCSLPSTAQPLSATSEKKPILTTETTETKIKVTKAGDAPPLLQFKLTNPVTYLIRWWKKVMSDEGLEIRFKLKPLTAIALTIIVVGLTAGGYGLAGLLWFVNKTPLKDTPIIKYLPQPVTSPNPWREAAFTGTLRSNSRNYAFLTTAEGEGITLVLPDNVDLAPYINRRILAVGLYNDQTHTLKINNVADIELLPWYVEEIPATSPSPSPTLIPTLKPTASPMRIFSPLPTGKSTPPLPE